MIFSTIQCIVKTLLSTRNIKPTTKYLCNLPQYTTFWCCEKLENIKGVIRSRKSKTNRQYNGQVKKHKRTNNDLQSITQKTKDRATRTPLKQVVKSGAPEG